VLGASIVAAIASSLAIAWALGETAGHSRSPKTQLFRAPVFYGVYTTCILDGAAFVWVIPNLVWLTVWVQIGRFDQYNPAPRSRGEIEARHPNGEDIAILLKNRISNCITW